MLGFNKKMFLGLSIACTIFSGRFWGSLPSKSERPITFICLNNRSCQARPTLADIKSNETFYYPFTISVNKCARRRNTINDPYAQVCVPSKVKNMNVKVFNLMSGVNETRF